MQEGKRTLEAQGFTSIYIYIFSETHTEFPQCDTITQKQLLCYSPSQTRLCTWCGGLARLTGLSPPPTCAGPGRRSHHAFALWR